MSYFGTDGIRGIANKEITAELAFKLGRIIGNSSEAKVKLVVGCDSRISSDMLENALVAGALSAGADVTVVGLIPTPAVAFLTTKLAANYGIMISASHNPVLDNGIKVFSSTGTKLSEDVQEMIEKQLDMDNHDYYPIGAKVGKLTRLSNAYKLYAEEILQVIEFDSFTTPMVLDFANGSASHVGKFVFDKFATNIEYICDEPDGLNINDGCGSTYIENITKHVKQSEAKIGFSFDGDADRLICVDALGNEVDGDYIVYLLAKYFKATNRLKKSSVVLTSMSNLGIISGLKALNIEVVLSDVGDRFVIEQMINHQICLGGESSGHIITSDYSTTGDALLTALFVLNALLYFDMTLNDLVNEVVKYPSKLLNTKVEDKEKVLTNELLQIEMKRIENILGDDGRILVRASGTEQLIRVLVECKNSEEATEFSQQLIDVIKQI